MKLLEDDWSAPGGVRPVEVEYPDEWVQNFMNWLRRTKGWREDLDLVEERIMVLNRQFLEYRNEQSTRLANVPTEYHEFRKWAVETGKVQTYPEATVLWNERKAA